MQGLLLTLLFLPLAIVPVLQKVKNHQTKILQKDSSHTEGLFRSTIPATVALPQVTPAEIISEAKVLGLTLLLALSFGSLAFDRHHPFPFALATFCQILIFRNIEPPFSFTHPHWRLWLGFPGLHFGWQGQSCKHTHTGTDRILQK